MIIIVIIIIIIISKYLYFKIATKICVSEIIIITYLLYFLAC
jgi:hypothetical protein